MVITLSCLVLIGGAAGSIGLVKAHESAENKSFLNRSKQNSTFIKKVDNALKKEGYNTVDYIIIGRTKDKSDITIKISKSEYEGEQTNNNIEKIVNDVAKQNKLGSFLVNVRTKD